MKPAIEFVIIGPCRSTWFKHKVMEVTSYSGNWKKQVHGRRDGDPTHMCASEISCKVASKEEGEARLAACDAIYASYEPSFETYNKIISRLRRERDERMAAVAKGEDDPPAHYLTWEDKKR